jgi:hypothetical protein
MYTDRDSYLDASVTEIEHACVLAIEEEFQTGVMSKYFNNGHHKDVYNCTKKNELKEKVDILVEKLKNTDVTKMSLKTQVWWDNYKSARANEQDKIAEIKRVHDVIAKICKEFPYEDIVCLLSANKFTIKDMFYTQNEKKEG